MYSNMIKMLMGFTSQRRQSLLPWDLFCQTKEEKGFAETIEKLFKIKFTQSGCKNIHHDVFMTFHSRY